MEKDNNSNLLSDFSIKSEILGLLNDFGEMAIENYSPLDVTIRDLNIMFELIQERFRFIKETIDFNTPKSLASLAIFSFKSLFIGENDIKIDNIEQKNEYFQVILIYGIERSFELIQKELINFIKELEVDAKKNKFYNDKIKYLFGNVFTNSIIYFIFLLIINNKPNPQDLNEFIIRLVESIYYVHLNFKYTELKNISYEQIINDLYDGFINNKIDNYVNISIEDNHLQITKFTVDEIVDYIEDSESVEASGHKEKKESEKSKKIQKSANKKDTIQTQKTKREKQKKIDDIIEDKNQNLIKGKTKNIINNRKKEDDKFIDTKDEENLNILQKIRIMEKEIKELKKYKEQNEKYKEQNEKYKEQNDKLVEENRKEINSAHTKITALKVEICRLRSDLDLIKIRRSLKAFINYMYIGLKLKGDFDYESKISNIVAKLNTFTSDKYDQNLIEKTQMFITNFTKSLESGKILAHEMDFDISILDQIFRAADGGKNYEDIKERLKKNSNADDVIKQLVKNREINFLNRKLLKAEEETINMQITDLSNLWFNEKK